jgi:hypothetical protein
MTYGERVALVAQVAGSIYHAVELPPNTRDRAGLAVDLAMVIVQKAEKKVTDDKSPGQWGASEVKV